MSKPGRESRGGTGGSASWITGSYDPELDLVYWGTGNPGPDWNGDARLGDNLYSDSVLALNSTTGNMDWYFQFTPHDVHDWDAIQVPDPRRHRVRGRDTQGHDVGANRNAFYYTLDRETGEFLVGKPYAKQTWAEGLDENGRPIRLPDTFPTEEGVVVSPSVGGGTNWWSPAYSPQTGPVLCQRIRRRGPVFLSGMKTTLRVRTSWAGVAWACDRRRTYHSAIRAIDPATGDRKWEFPIQPRSTAGVTTTAGNLVFSGAVDGYFFALNAETGEGALAYVRRHQGSRCSNDVRRRRQAIRHHRGAGNVIFTFGLSD